MQFFEILERIVDRDEISAMQLTARRSEISAAGCSAGKKRKQHHEIQQK